MFALAGTAFGFGVGAKGPDVYAVQGMPKSLGYYAGTIDGGYGSQTASGLRAFRQMIGLPVTGSVDDKTLKNILWACEKLKTSGPARAPAPAPASSAGMTAEEKQMHDLIN